MGALHSEPTNHNRNTMNQLTRPGSPIPVSLSSRGAHFSAMIVITLVFVWAIHFRGGFALHSDNAELILNVHAVVMVLGVPAVGEGVMAYRVYPVGKVAKNCIHVTLMLVGLGLRIFGVYTAFRFHRQRKIPNMYSFHSWLGITGIFLFSAQWLGGFLIFVYTRLTGSTREHLSTIHALAGLLVSLLGVGSVLTGFGETGGKPLPEELLVNFIGLFVFFFALCVAITSALQRVRTI